MGVRTPRKSVSVSFCVLRLEESEVFTNVVVVVRGWLGRAIFIGGGVRYRTEAGPFNENPELWQ